MKLTDNSVKDAAYKERWPVSVYDVAAFEDWLEDSAREGYRLVGFRRGCGYFDRSAPQECRYRLKPLLKREKAPDPEWVETYRALGWEYVATLKGTYHVWRCGDPAAPELDTDPVVQGEGFRYLKRRMVRQAVIYLLLLLALAGLMVWSWLTGPMPLWTALERGVPFQTLLYGLMLLEAAALECLDLRNMRRLLRTLRTGIPLERPRPYRSQQWPIRIGWTSLAVFWAVCLIVPLFGTSGFSPVYAWDASERETPKPGVVYADLRELDGVPEDCVSYSKVQTKIHELAPRMYWTRQYANLPDGTELYAYTSYYHLLSDRLAPAMERDLLEWQVHPENEMEVARIDDAALDGFWWCTLSDGRQCVVAFLGRNILYLQYEGPTDLRTAGDYFAELLEG